MSENLLVPLDLLLGGHLTGYGHHFENINSAQHKFRFLLVKVKSRATNFEVFGVGQFIGDVIFNI